MKQILVMGGGLIGMRHVQTVQAHADCALVGLVDPDPAIAVDVVRFDELDDVKDHVDGVIIATPTHLHSAHGIMAAERGWHVLVEKPVAGDMQEARDLEAALASTKIRSLVGHHRRYHARVGQLKACLADNLIGDVVGVSMIWAMCKPDAYFAQNWRTAGGSPVMINLVHDIDLLRFVVGEITQVAALRGTSLRSTARIESGAVALAFANGATGTISFADTSPSPWGFEAATGENPNIGTTSQDMLWITGTKGAVSFPSMTVWHGTDWGDAARTAPLVAAENSRTPLEAQLDHFLAVIDGADPLIDVADAARTLAIAQQIEEQMGDYTIHPSQNAPAKIGHHEPTH